jgi:site-specific DNA recombinase
MTKRRRHSPAVAQIRCAVYCRKSTEEGLEQAFNSLVAQREAAEAFIASQQHAGWVCLPQHYDDGGFSGADTDRPALQRLLADIAAGQVDCVVVQRVDRLSRSLRDFARLMETFETRQVAFVSVTQHFNSATSMGRLVLNVLLSFAQFERELIAERTRDKMAATRRKGKWAGGPLILGYDLDDGRLVVNETEAARVRNIFALYLQRGELLPVVQELDRRGWVNKQRTTQAGRVCGGAPFTTHALHRLLTNVAYTGQVRYKDEVHAGEHPAILDAALFQRVQDRLRRPRRSNTARSPRGRSGALLAGLLRCRTCDRAMTPAHTIKNGGTRYRYYVCLTAQKRGWDACPSKSVPARTIERFVLERLRGLAAESAAVPADVATALTARSPQQQARCLRTLVARVDYDGAYERVAITLHNNGRPPNAAAVHRLDREKRA